MPAAEARAEPAPAAAETETVSGPQAPPEAAPATLLVEDAADTVGPAQMRKSAFLSELRASACAAAEEALAGTGRTADGCPYVDYWFGYFGARSSQQVERAIRRYAPETAGAAAARDYIAPVAARVRRGVMTWARTGQITGVPEGVPTALPEAGAAPTGPLLLKAREGARPAPDDPHAVRRRLGGGRPLDGGLRSRMESAFGSDFSRVRLHTDARAASLATGLNARAFTIGSDVAFAGGEYQPGTPVGDALIAHELAHVVQQGGAPASEPRHKGAPGYGALEEDADRSAVGAVVSMWTGVRDGLANLAHNALPRLKSGLRLQRCKRSTTGSQPCTSRTTAPAPVKTVTVRHTHLWSGLGNGDFTRHLTRANQIYGTAGINLTAGNAMTVSEADTKDPGLLGSDAALAVSSDPPRTSSYTAEETALMSRNSASGEITAYYVKDMVNTTLWGLTYVDSDGVVLEPGVIDRVLAHEIGHVLIGLGHPTNNDNIMAQSSVATGVDCLSDDQITAARGSSLAR